MPSKSRKVKERRHFKAVAVPEQPASVIPPPVIVNPNELSVVQKSVPVTTGTPARNAKPAPVSTYSYINRELLTITLLSAAMLAVVIVMSIVLS